MNQDTFDGFEAEGRILDRARIKRYRAAMFRQVNNELYALGKTYHDGVPLARIDEILSRADFDPLPQMILCGREGRIHESVGHNRWLAMTWYKMESGRYEIVAYVS